MCVNICIQREIYVRVQDVCPQGLCMHVHSSGEHMHGMEMCM